MEGPDASGPAGQWFALRDHTADIAVAATAPTLSGVFAAVADGLAAAHVDAVPDDGDRFELAVAAESREALLFDYLDRLIYERDVRDVLPVENEAAVVEADGQWRVDASARGVPVAAIDAREIKAVTYSEMELARADGGWRAYVVFDV
jgi:SHS2 domain-containing protein